MGRLIQKTEKSIDESYDGYDVNFIIPEFLPQSSDWMKPVPTSNVTSWDEFLERGSPMDIHSSKSDDKRHSSKEKTLFIEDMSTDDTSSIGDKYLTNYWYKQ